MRVVAVSDVGGAVFNEGGLGIPALSNHVAEAGTVACFHGGEEIEQDELWDVECELLVPAALGGVITAPVAERLSTRVVVEAANGPTTVAGQGVLDERGIVVVPDILANAGGVTASYFEWAQARQGYPWPDNLVAERLRERMEQAFMAVWARADNLRVAMRLAAYVVGVERVAAAHEARGLFP
jgi:glutamate dehydrogenase (NAD(P)+)